MRIAARELEQFCVQVLRGAGVSETDARLTAEILVLADSWGVFTHGVKNLRGYLRRIVAGGIRRDTRPCLVSEGPAWAIIDGANTLGMVASAFAMHTTIAKARGAGVGYSALRNSCHFGAAGCYAVMAAHQGFIGIAMCNDTPTVTAPGARGPVFGSNPLAFAAPVQGRDPILLDIATSTVAGGKVFAAAAQGQQLPAGWVVDAQGRATTDPTVWPHAGSLTPMAGHKGYGLALMIETLSSVMSGAAVVREVLSWSFADPSLPTEHSAAFLAIDPTAILGAGRAADRLAQMVHDLHALPKAEGEERIYVPGEKEWERRRKALAEGIDLPADVTAVVHQLAREVGLETLLTPLTSDLPPPRRAKAPLRRDGG